MSVLTRRRILFSSLGVVSLAIGSATYVLFRPTTLLMFHWIKALGLMNPIRVARESASGFERILPTWFVFSLPFALWVFSYMFIVEAIWMPVQSSARVAWFWCVPLIAIVAELAQIEHIIPGSFDWVDLVAIVFAVILAYSVASSSVVKTM